MDVPTPEQSKPTARQWVTGVLVAVIGVTWQYTALWLVERWVQTYPRVTDVVMDRLPRLNFGIWGELFFFGLLVLILVLFFRRQAWDTPKVLLTLGIFYFVRGTIQLFLPIGAPLNALPPDQRLNLWGFASHAYFPGGHIGVLTILTMSLKNQVIRRWAWVGVLLFGAGTLLAKNHYTADSIVGVLLGYAIFTLIQQWWFKNKLPAKAQSIRI